MFMFNIPYMSIKMIKGAGKNNTQFTCCDCIFFLWYLEIQLNFILKTQKNWRMTTLLFSSIILFLNLHYFCHFIFYTAENKFGVQASIVRIQKHIDILKPTKWRLLWETAKNVTAHNHHPSAHWNNLHQKLRWQRQYFVRQSNEKTSFQHQFCAFILNWTAYFLTFKRVSGHEFPWISFFSFLFSLSNTFIYERGMATLAEQQLPLLRITVCFPMLNIQSQYT